MDNIASGVGPLHNCQRTSGVHTTIGICKICSNRDFPNEVSDKHKRLKKFLFVGSSIAKLCTDLYGIPWRYERCNFNNLVAEVPVFSVFWRKKTDTAKPFSIDFSTTLNLRVFSS